MVRTYKDKVLTEIFPGRTWVPKTLIFAKDDSNAEDIVKIVREEFAKGNDLATPLQSMSRKTKPSEGERRAMVGYYPQYKVAAELIYSSLLAGSLEWIRIADPEAERVDDIQIASHGRIDAYQVKWGETVQNISFRELTTDKKDESKPNLIKQLADGWRQLSSLYMDREVFVHLLTCHVPSPNAKVPVDDPAPLQANFQGFLRDCWYDRSWTAKGFKGIPPGWRSTINAIQLAADIADGELFDFIRSCELEFQYRFFSQDITARSENRRVRDIEHLLNLIITIAGGERRIVQLSCTELLKQLGWETRFKLYFKHEFWVDERLYRPVSSTIIELESSLSRFSKGYIALVGTPGSGKSTTLTQFLRYRKGYRIIRYYAFVRDDTQLGRGEALKFLHDLVIALKEQGIRGNIRSYPETRAELLDHLTSQLSELGERWQHDHIKTLILVDGLDHIEREQSPERSLLRDLPLPDSLPDGVLLILGSQKINLEGLSPRIEAHLKEPDRTLTMRPLDRPTVYAIVDLVPLKVSLTTHQKDKVFHLSDGHPLALIYLLQKLQFISESEQIDKILESANPYQGHIEQDYEIYWKNIETDTTVRELLALMSRLRGAISLPDIVSWAGEETVRQIMDTARHYFRKDEDDRWHFFHNSFRQFILMKTGRNLLGQEDISRHQSFHRQLADFAAAAPTGTEWSWEELYHRACAGDKKKTLELGSQKNFRNQFYSWRSIEDILDDITLCLKAARDELDGLAIIRAMLIEAELSERNRNLEENETDMPRLLLELKGATAAIAYVVRSHELRIDATAALKFCALLVQRGDIETARVVFDAAEPLDILKGLEGIEGGRAGNKQDVKSWAYIAHHFRSFENILQAIDQLRAESRSFPGWDPEQAKKYICKSVLRSLANGVYDSGDFGKIELFKKFVEHREEAEEIILNMDFQACYERRNDSEAQSALERILRWAEHGDLDPSEKLIISEFLLRIRGDRKAAAEWIEGIGQPDLYKDEVGNEWSNLSPFLYRIRFNRLSAALGRQFDPLKAVPSVEDEKQEATIIFERMIVLLANIWGRSWGNKLDSPSEIMNQIHPALVLFNRNAHGTDDWSKWYRFNRAAHDYFSFLIQAVATHGINAVIALAKAFECQWENNETKQYWDKSLRRHIALELYRAGIQVETAVKHLSIIEEEMGIWDNLYDRIRECSSQAFAWIDIGESKRAENLLPRMLESSFGFYDDKDYRFQLWTEWLKKLNTVQQIGIVDRIRQFSGALVVLEQAGRGRHVQDGAKDLIETAALWSPNYAFSLSKWLMDNRSLLFQNAIEGLSIAALKSETPPIEIILNVLAHLLIPFQTSSSSDVTALFSQKCVLSSNKEPAERFLNELVAAIETKAFPTERNELWQGLINGLRRVGTDTYWLETKLSKTPKRDDSTHYPHVTLSSGDKLRVEDVTARVNSYETFIVLLDSVVAAEYFKWEDVLAGIVHGLNYDQIVNLRNRLLKYELRQNAEYMFAKKLLELGCKKEASQIAEKIMKTSSPSGWNPRYDGGSRLSAAKIRIELDREDGRKKSFQMFVDDYLSDARYPSDLLWSLEELMPILFDKAPLEAIWGEIEQHVYQLYDFSHADNFPPSPQDSDKASYHTAMLLSLLEFAVTMPVPEVRQAAFKALCQLILKNTDDNAALVPLKNLLSSDDASQICALAVLEAASSIRRDFIMRFSDEYTRLSASPNMLIRHMAIKFVDALQLKRQEIDKARNNLPLTYTLELPEVLMPGYVLPYGNIPAGQPYPDSDDPLEMIRPIKPWFDKLSKLTKIPLQNLLARASFQMKSLSPMDKWDKKAEMKLQAWLNAANLKLSYIRFRPSLAFQAFCHILAELVDAKAIDDHSFSLIRRDIIVHEPVLSLTEPSLRPKEIIIPAKEEIGAYPKKNWMDVGHEALPSLLSHMEDGRLIIAELSRVVRFEWEMPSEKRFSMVCHKDWPEQSNLENANEFFPSDTKWYASDYPHLKDASEWLSTAVLGTPLQLEFGAMQWLAINPTIPRALGWTLSSEGLFRWLDTSGAIAAESLWWKDGPIHRLPPRFDDVCSEGWLITISKSAAEEILQITRQAIQLCAIVRSFEKQGKMTTIKIERREWLAN